MRNRRKEQIERTPTPRRRQAKKMENEKEEEKEKIGIQKWMKIGEYKKGWQEPKTEKKVSTPCLIKLEKNTAKIEP